MVGEILLLAYVVVAVVVGVVVFRKTISWLADTDRVMPLVPLSTGFKWGFLAFFVALLFESLVLYAFWNTREAYVALAVTVGLIEEGAKLVPYAFTRSASGLYRRNLSVKTALAFGIIEGVLYSLFFIASGNVLGAILRAIVVMFHVVWTAMALEKALRGSLLAGYLKAAVMHSLYDAPMLVFLSGSGVWPVLAALAGIAVLVYAYASIDDVFGFAYTCARREIEERKMLKIEGEGLTSSP